MFGLFSWREVHLGHSHENYMNYQELLTDHGIPYKTKIHTNGGFIPVSRGRTRSGSIEGYNRIYYIYVKESDYDRARSLLQSHRAGR